MVPHFHFQEVLKHVKHVCCGVKAIFPWCSVAVGKHPVGFIVIHSVVIDVEQFLMLLCHQVVWPRERLQRPSHGPAWTQSGGPVQFLLTSFHNENSPDASRPGNLHLIIPTSVKPLLAEVLRLKNT